MADAPERIWLWPAELEDGVDKFVSFPDQPYPSGSTEYIRAEKAEAELAAAQQQKTEFLDRVEKAIKATMLRLGKHPDIRRIMAPQVMWGAGDSCISAIRAALSNNGRGE